MDERHTPMLNRNLLPRAVCLFNRRRSLLSYAPFLQTPFLLRPMAHDRLQMHLSFFDISHRHLSIGHRCPYKSRFKPRPGSIPFIQINNNRFLDWQLIPRARKKRLSTSTIDSLCSPDQKSKRGKDANSDSFIPSQQNDTQDISVDDYLTPKVTEPPPSDKEHTNQYVAHAESQTCIEVESIFVKK